MDVKNYLKGLGIVVPEKSSYTTRWHVPYIGTSWTLVDGYEFFNNDPSDNTGNFPKKGQLTKKSPCTIFGVQVCAEVGSGTYAQQRTLMQNLLAYGRLELRKGTTLIETLLASQVPGVEGGPHTLACAANDTTASTVTSVGHIVPRPGLLGIPGGIFLKDTDNFNLKQRFIDDGALAAANALNALEFKYGYVLHIMVHDPDGENNLSCPIKE